MMQKSSNTNEQLKTPGRNINIFTPNVRKTEINLPSKSIK